MKLMMLQELCVSLSLLLLLQTSQAFKIRNQEPLKCDNNDEVLSLPFRSRELQTSTPAPPECNLGTTRGGTASLLMDFVGQPSKLTAAEVAILTSTIRTAYNELPFCSSPQFIQLDTVQLVTPLLNFAAVVSEEEDDLFFTLEFAITTSCQGCVNEASVLFSDNGGNLSSQCPCEGPRAPLFMIEFANLLDPFLTSRAISSIFFFDFAAQLSEVSTCPAYSDEFDTSSVVVEFFGCPLDLTQTMLDDMATALVSTYNRMNGAGGSTRFCDVFFREMVSATAILEEDFEVLDGRRRDEEEFPIPERQLQEDEFFCPDFFEVRFDVVARCRGCNTTTSTLFDEAEDVNFFDDDSFFDDDNFTVFEDDNVTDGIDDIFNRRRAFEKKFLSQQQPVEREWFEYDRELQMSSCRCPANPSYRAITEEEMIFGFGLTIANIPTLPTNLTVEDVIEIEVVTCTGPLEPFESIIEVTLETDSADGTVSQALIDTFTRTFERSYNDLSDRFCDSFFRQVQTVQVLNVTVVPATPQRLLQRRPGGRPGNFTPTFFQNFRYLAGGRCRGCPRKGQLFDDAGRRRLQMHQKKKRSPPKVVSDQKYRRLQTADDQCFCATVNFVEGAPAEREFADRYTSDFARLNTGGVLSEQYAVSAIQEEVFDDTVTQPPRTECATNQECVDMSTGTMCVNNECLNEGKPRFTLTWTGDDDLDLSVITPAGREIYFGDSFDPVTNGVFDTSYVQDVFGDHVESIYFPRSGSAPGGEYTILVAPFEEVGSPDSWKLEVYLFGQEAPVQVVEGSGEDEVVFQYGDAPSVPTICNLADSTVQCCSDQDCASDSSIERTCANRQCVAQGSPRITLSWYGNDDLLLVVLSPYGDEILDEVPFGEFSGGIFEPDRNRNLEVEAFHTESVYFPAGSDPGEYDFFVEDQEQRGVQDVWQLVVNVDGEDVVMETGSGFGAFVYDTPECAVEEDCPSNETCSAVGLCISEGSPRITLTWEGGDDLDLFVITPDGDRIDFFSEFNELSGGGIEADLDEVNGRHFEYVYFEISDEFQTPVGEYQIGVESFFIKDEPDTWEITVFEDGVETQTWEGVGDLMFTYEYTGPSGTTLPPTPAPVFCFSGETTVVTEGRGKMLMKDLELGDKVEIDANSFSSVYSFGHRHDSLEAEYLQILPSELEISGDHMIFVQGGNAVPASMLRVGDRLENGVAITGIKRLIRRGMYAPFTTTGTLLVNNVSVSSYIAFQESDRLKIGSNTQTPLTFQWLAHTFQFPHRWWCQYVSTCSTETYTDAGVSTWVDLPFRLAKLWLQAEPVTMMVVSVPVLVLYSALSFAQHFLLPLLVMSCLIHSSSWRKKNVV